MKSLSLKSQRENFLESLNYVVELCDYQLNGEFEQFGGKKIFGELWKKKIVKILFNITLPIILLVYDFFALILYITGTLFYKKKSVNNSRVFLSLSSGLINVSKRANICNEEDLWIYTPFKNKYANEEKNTLCTLSIINIWHVLTAWLQSIIVRIQVLSRFGYRYFFLSQKAFEWFLLDFSLRKIPEETALYFANQQDRESILIDKLPHKTKVLVQHGGKYALRKEHPRLVYLDQFKIYVLKTSYKHSTFTRVYCFTELEKAAFSYSFANKPEYVIIGYNFKTTFKPENKSILLITEYGEFFEKEKKIIKELQGVPAELYVKGHPTQPQREYLKLKEKCNFVFLTGPNFPDVDLVLSYNSTLAHEYESIGTKVIYYDDIEIENIKNVVELELYKNN